LKILPDSSMLCGMKCLVTAGPTCEPLDEVRRLTNFSTGRLGTELANFLVAQSHHVTLLIGQQASWQGERLAAKVETFTTMDSLRDLLRALSAEAVDVVLHTAAVSDFRFGKVWLRSAQGELTEVKDGKISSRQGTLLAELVPTPKIIGELRQWFPKTRLIGWKYEVDGNRADAVQEAKKQIQTCLTDACVANGPAYGNGFGLVTSEEGPRHLPDHLKLFTALAQIIGA